MFYNTTMVKEEEKRKAQSKNYKSFVVLKSFEFFINTYVSLFRKKKLTHHKSSSDGKETAKVD